jgi:serine O-acetyltransferase
MVLFPGFHERERIGRLNARYVIGDRCARIFHALKAEVEKSLLHAVRRDGGDGPEARAAGPEAERIAMELLEALPAIRAVLQVDAEAALQGDPAARSHVEVLLAYPSIRAIGIFRIAHFLHERQVPLIPRMMTEFIHARTGIDIHPGATIGPGLFIDHGTGVVIGETTVIGRFCKLYQGVTLGALSVEKHGAPGWHPSQRHPTLEDRVTVYAGATILGGRTVIGEGSVIGGNVWLTRSVPPGTKVLIEPPFLVYRTSDGELTKEALDFQI